MCSIIIQYLYILQNVKLTFKVNFSSLLTIKAVYIHFALSCTFYFLKFRSWKKCNIYIWYGKYNVRNTTDKQPKKLNSHCWKRTVVNILILLNACFWKWNCCIVLNCIILWPLLLFKSILYCDFLMWKILYEKFSSHTVF